MPLVALGLNHHTAPVSVRERVAVEPDAVPERLQRLAALDTVREVALVSTCNRTEVFANLEIGSVERVAEQCFATTPSEFEAVSPYLVTLSERAAVRHLLRVSSGLDSMILGEPQILGQVKSAWVQARDQGTLGQSLGRLFQHAFAVAKRVRSDTDIGAGAVSVAYAAVQLTGRLFDRLEDKTALLLGAGETSELVLQHLQGQGVGQVLIANRSLARADTLAQRFGAEAIALADLDTHLHRADIVIASTASPRPVFGKGTVETALRQRKRRPMLMIDIAVPRDIEAEVGQLDDVFLYTVDDLAHIVDAGQQTRRDAAELGEHIVEHETDAFMRWLAERGALDSVLTLRDHAQTIEQQTLARATRRLRAGDDPEAVLAHLAHALTQRLLHVPVSELRNAAREGDATLLDAAARLFRLDDNHDTRD
ncbi:MAG: glutamyl-tRNA reductase [Pseudomonadota bacterium]